MDISHFYSVQIRSSGTKSINQQSFNEEIQS